jgi:hypothetical protein
MKEPDRPILRLKNRELVPAEEDRRVDLGEFHLLLPRRDYEVEYKVAELGKVSPTLEFLLRLVKAVPGISYQDTADFFGYSPREMRYVVDEARRCYGRLRNPFPNEREEHDENKTVSIKNSSH